MSIKLLLLSSVEVLSHPGHSYLSVDLLVQLDLFGKVKFFKNFYNT